MLIDESAFPGYRIILDGFVLPSNKDISPDKANIFPFRQIAEKLGYTVSWDASTDTASATKNELTVTLDLTNKTFGGKSFSLEVSEGVTYIDKTLLFELFGKGVQTDEFSKTIHLI